MEQQGGNHSVDYVRLEKDLSSDNDDEREGSLLLHQGGRGDEEDELVGPTNPRNIKSWKWWVKIISLVIGLAILAVIVFKWLGGFLMQKMVVSFLNWEMERFSPAELAVAIIASMAGWLDKHPQQASVLRLAVVTADIKYCPYLLGSLVGMVPDTLIFLYSGILMRSFADKAADKKMVSTKQMVFDVAGFAVAVAATVTIGIYTKRQLAQREEMKKKEPLHEFS